MRARSLTLLVLAGACLCGALSAQSEAPQPAAPSQPRVDVLNSAGLRGAFESLAQRYPGMCKIENLPEAPELFSATLAYASQTEKLPEILIAGSLDARELTPALACLALAENLLSGPDVRTLLERCAIVIVPGLGGVSRDLRFETPARVSAGSLAPFDDDHDGVSDEDAPEDMDADGVIRQMRIRRTGGCFRVSDIDSRLMIAVEAGETGTHDVLWEGSDNDGDEAINEDAPGTLGPARDWAIRWQESSPESALFPMLMRETRALAALIAAHPGIVLALDVRSLGAGPGAASGPPEKEGGMPAADRAALERVVAGWSRTTGRKTGKLVNPSPPGNLLDWLYEGCGIPAFSYPLADLPSYDAEQMGKKKGPGEAPVEPVREPTETEKEQLRWLASTPEHCAAWTAFRHPQLGEVEIGGWAIGARYDPPPAAANDGLAHLAAFVRELVAAPANVGIASVEAQDRGDGVYRLRLKLVNSGALAYRPVFAEQKRIGLGMFISMAEHTEWSLLEGARRRTLENLAPGETAEFEWMLRAPAPAVKIAFNIECERAKNLRHEVSIADCLPVSPR